MEEESRKSAMWKARYVNRVEAFSILEAKNSRSLHEQQHRWNISEEEEDMHKGRRVKWKFMRKMSCSSGMKVLATDCRYLSCWYHVQQKLSFCFWNKTFCVSESNQSFVCCCTGSYFLIQVINMCSLLGLQWNNNGKTFWGDDQYWRVANAEVFCSKILLDEFSCVKFVSVGQRVHFQQAPWKVPSLQLTGHVSQYVMLISQTPTSHCFQHRRLFHIQPSPVLIALNEEPSSENKWLSIFHKSVPN